MGVWDSSYSCSPTHPPKPDMLPDVCGSDGGRGGEQQSCPPRCGTFGVVEFANRACKTDPAAAEAISATAAAPHSTRGDASRFRRHKTENLAPKMGHSHWLLAHWS